MAEFTERTSRPLHSERATEPLFNVGFENLPVPIYVTDYSGLITFWNAAAATLASRVPRIHHDRWSIIEKTFRADGSELPLEQSPMAVALHGGEVETDAEYIGERPDGSRFWYSAHPTILRDRAGLISGGACVLFDISALKQAEGKADRTSRLLAAIVDSSDEAIISKDLNGIITSWNTGAQRLFGYTAEEVIGRSVTMLIPPERLDEEPAILTKVKAGERVDHFETVRRRKDGRLVDISLTISPIKETSGAIVGASKIAKDITIQKRIDAQIRRTNRELEQFAFYASHDLQEPLRRVKLYSELLERHCEGALDGEAREFLKHLQSGASRMELLVRDLLEYSEEIRWEGIPEAQTDANEALSGAMQNLAGPVQESGARITSDVLPVVQMHAIHLRQIFQKLVGNAIKYCSVGRPPIVHITAAAEVGQWHFLVTDNGIGIDSEYYEKIFGLFKRLHTYDEYPGTGIGLAICQRIVNRYQGEIWLESEVGEGSVFHFTIRR